MGHLSFIYTLPHLGKSSNIKNKFEGSLGLSTGLSFTSQPNSPLPASVTATNHLPSWVHHALLYTVTGKSYFLCLPYPCLSPISCFKAPHPYFDYPTLPVGTTALFLLPQARCKNNIGRCGLQQTEEPLCLLISSSPQATCSQLGVQTQSYRFWFFK